jgi:thiamine biosynthesis lipoprotein
MSQLLARFRQNRKQLGSQADVVILASSETRAQEVYNALWKQMDLFEARFSRFNETSELTRLNKCAGKPVKVSEEFREMMLCCKKYNHITSGVFNPLILPLLQTAGYKGSWPQVSHYNASLDYSNRLMKSFDEVAIEPDTVCLPEESALDLGGIGKGYALDVASRLLEDMGISNYCVSFGGDIVCSGSDKDNTNWKIGIAYVHDHDRPIAFFINPDHKKYAIASSTVVRRKGTGWNHLIDPSTGKPTQSPVKMASAVTRKGVSADIYAKFFLLQPNGTLNSTSSSDEVLSVLFQYEGSSSISQQKNYISLL